jgi:hypothetical protein
MRGEEMTKTAIVAIGAMLVLTGAQTAHAQVFGPCTVEAAATQQECLATGNPPPECAAYYQDDVAECYASGNGHIGGFIGSRRGPAPRRVSAPPRAAPHAAPASHPAAKGSRR